MDQSSAGGVGDVAAKRPNLSTSGEDRLSALPDDILLLILLRLDTITEAAGTSVLARRWRRMWRLLPELTFGLPPDDRHIRKVLEASEAPALRKIHVDTKDDSAEYVAAWLPLAARRLYGALIYCNIVEEAAQDQVDGAIPLPCFGNATAIDLDLGFLALTLPSSGEFTRLTELHLDRVRFQGTCEVGDVISSPRCPGLRSLSLRNTRGLVSLALRSDSLMRMDLSRVYGLVQLKINTSALKDLTVFMCFGFGRNQPIADISAPQLESLQWRDAYDPSSVELGSLGQLQRLGTWCFLVYGRHDNFYNQDFLWLLQRCQFIQSLNLALTFRGTQSTSNMPYLMEYINYFPRVTSLAMLVMNEGHAFGACLFHVLRLCSGLRRLSLYLCHNVPSTCNLEAKLTCPVSCIYCDEQTNWNIEELSLNCLQEVEIKGLRGVKHELEFLKQLFNLAVVFEKLKITFDDCVGKSKAKEFCQWLSSISRPETLKEFYMYTQCGSVELLLLEDEGTGV